MFNLSPIILVPIQFHISTLVKKILYYIFWGLSHILPQENVRKPMVLVEGIQGGVKNKMDIHFVSVNVSWASLERMD